MVDYWFLPPYIESGKKIARTVEVILSALGGEKEEDRVFFFLFLRAGQRRERKRASEQSDLAGGGGSQSGNDGVTSCLCGWRNEPGMDLAWTMMSMQEHRCC